MTNLIPFNHENPVQWKHHNDATLGRIHDDALKALINGVLNLHELEQTGKWKNAGRRFDYSKSTFEVYLQHHTTWSLKDFRLLEEVVFEHFGELRRTGIASVLQRLKKLRNEPNPLKKRRSRRPQLVRPEK